MDILSFQVDNEEIDNRVDVGNEMMDVVANEFDDDDEFINEPVGKKINFERQNQKKNFIQIETRSLKQNHQKKHRQGKI